MMQDIGQYPMKFAPVDKPKKNYIYLYVYLYAGTDTKELNFRSLIIEQNTPKFPDTMLNQ